MQPELAIFSAENSTLKGLNDKQLEAVTHENGPLLIIAGAGTGKTTVITRRIAYLIEKGLAKPSEILALTFTEKAAAEMEERVDLLLPYGYTDVTVATFHAFGDRLLRDYSIELGLPANFKVLTGVEQAIFMRQNLYKFELKHYRPLSNPTTHIEALLNHFSRLKDELITPEAYLEYASQLAHNVTTPKPLLGKEGRDGPPLLPSDPPPARGGDGGGGREGIGVVGEESEKVLELAKAYHKYQELMIEAGNLDFGDLIYLSFKLLTDHPAILKECQNKFTYVLVDEYQDTNYAQNEIVKLLGGGTNNITVVGDDDQSIYRFRGASISNILEFKTAFPDTKEVVLIDNYRSTQEILDTAYTLIQHNNPDRLEVKNNIDKRLVGIKHGPQPEFVLADTLSGEADIVAEKIRDLRESEGLSYKDFAILVRANSHANPFIQALNVNGIPLTYSGNSDLFSQPEVKMLIALIKVLAYTDDNLSFYTLATSELYNITPGTLADLFSLSKRTNRSIYSLLEHKLSETFDFNENLAGIYTDLKKYRDLCRELNTGELLYQYLNDRGYFKKLSEEASVENEKKMSNIAKFFDRITQFNHASEDKSLISFLNNMEMMLEYGDEVAVGDIDPEIDAVNILTAHGSKGLEWKVVFVVNLVSDRFPSRRKREQIPIPEYLIKERLPEGDFHEEEERRLFYVAATRAKERLIFTAAEDCGGKRKKKVSPFVFEALPDLAIQQASVRLSHLEKIERFAKTDIPHAPLPYKFSKGLMKLSRAAIDDYYTCPKKFYFTHVVRIPLLENQALMYGTAIHSAIGRYFNARMKREKVTLDELNSCFKDALKSLGFVSLEHFKERRTAGLETIKRFYEEAKTDPRIPAGVEIPFEFADKTVIVNGRYDLLFKNEKSVEITDFKTSNIRTQEDADKQIKDSTQMKVYALAWREKYGIIPKTVLHFIEYGLKGEKTYANEELDEVREMILEVADGIRQNQMEAKPDWNSCQWCAFNSICPNSAKK